MYISIFFTKKSPHKPKKKIAKKWKNNFVLPKWENNFCEWIYSIGNERRKKNRAWFCQWNAKNLQPVRSTLCHIWWMATHATKYLIYAYCVPNTFHGVISLPFQFDNIASGQVKMIVYWVLIIVNHPLVSLSSPPPPPPPPSSSLSFLYNKIKLLIAYVKREFSN